MEITIYILLALLIANIILVYVFRAKPEARNAELEQKIEGLSTSLNKIESSLRDDFRINRQENAEHAKAGREELAQNIKDFSNASVTQLEKAFKGFQEAFDANVKSFNDLQKEKFKGLEDKQDALVKSTEKKLEDMRITVDEKLQKTLNDRLTQSFDLVTKQLAGVQKGLGEMQSLAKDVGGLKKVLSNVKTRGGVGELQLERLLDQILSPEQYEANVKTKKGSKDNVEFAIKLPGRDSDKSVVYLPIDAKFPKDSYEQLLNAYDSADAELIKAASRNFDNAVKSFAKDISSKYIDPPGTTDFGIMFLPFEGIYAEVVRKPDLLEDLQRNYKIVVTGPTTLAAILNSLQIGFRTLAIQKHTSEVWQVLGAVKKEFETFGGLMEKAKGNIQTGLNQLDEVIGVRSRAISKKLKGVESLGTSEAKMILPGDEREGELEGSDP